MTDKQQELLEIVRREYPKSAGIFEQAYSGNSRCAGIKAHCLECCWMDRKAIRECTSSQCGIWLYRPYRAEDAEEGSIDIDNMIEMTSGIAKTA